MLTSYLTAKQARKHGEVNELDYESMGKIIEHNIIIQISKATIDRYLFCALVSAPA